MIACASLDARFIWNSYSVTPFENVRTAVFSLSYRALLLRDFQLDQRSHYVVAMVEVLAMRITPFGQAWVHGERYRTAVGLFAIEVWYIFHLFLGKLVSDSGIRDLKAE